MTRSEDDQLVWYDADLSLSQSGDFVIINKTLTRSITGEWIKNIKESLTNLSRFDNWWCCVKQQVI